MNLAIGPMPERAPAPPASPRFGERTILRLGIGLAASFLAASVVSGLLPVGGLHGWVATHLALAGAATVAIGTFMPHFGVTLAGTRPEPWGVRLTGVLALALGMATVALGRPLGGPDLAAAGGLLVLAGIGITAWTTYAPLRAGLARRHPIVQLTYGVALADLAVGASLAVLLLVGWPPVAEAWVTLKPAHAWLNVFGFVSLTITGTLIYLYPTMLGARIRPQPAVAAAVIGLLAGPPLVAAGHAAQVRELALAGGAGSVAGAVGLLAYGIDTWPRRGRWTSDFAWHALATYHGLAGMAWFVVATTWALARIGVDGVSAPGWTLGTMALPIIGGWATQVLVAAWSYLLPAVGPGDPASRARQRALLGRGAAPRVIAWNAGLVLLLPGLVATSWWLIVPGAILYAFAALSALVLLAGALLTSGRAGG
jgi:nitrite reductase (NO-forming)